MNEFDWRRRRRWILGLAWMSLIPVLIRFLIVRSALPQTMAIHFSNTGTVNGWMSRDFFILSTAVFFAVSLLPITVFIGRAPNYGPARFIIIPMFAAVGLELGISWQLITYNIHPAATKGAFTVEHLGFELALIGATIALVILPFLRLSSRKPAKRDGVIRSAAHVQSTEIHRNWRLLLVLAPIALLVIAIWALVVPTRDLFLSFILGTAGCILLAACFFVVRGFIYQIRDDGVDIRTLGIRLAFIHWNEVKNIAIVPVRALHDLGGWGIRKYPHGTAYFLGGNQAVEIKTFDGDFLLGHSDVQRLLSKLARYAPGGQTDH